MLSKIKTPKNKFKFQYSATSSMFLSPVNNKELIEHISSLKNNCAAGPDGISSAIIKKFHLYFIEPLRHIINLSFKTGHVPSYFKTAIVTPIFKSGDPHLVNNYRPISVINNFSKIFEKCLKNRLQNFFKVNHILSDNQFGFREGLSTTDAILEFTKKVTNCLDSGTNCLAVFLDLAKAFDTVPHSTLLNVLNSYGGTWYRLKSVFQLLE